MKEILCNQELEEGKSIFLAGPTRRNSDYSKSWRKEAVNILNELGYDGLVYIPELPDGVPFDESEEGLYKQHYWEWNALEKADRIVFWIPRKVNDGMPAFTTNVEFGRYMEMRPEHCILGYPEDAERMDYLKHLYETCNPDKPIFHTLRDTLEYTVKSLGE